METELNDAIREIRSNFLLSPSAPVLSRIASIGSGLNNNYEAIGKAFEQNLLSFVSTMSMPFSLASMGVHQRHFQRIHLAERIRVMPIPSPDGRTEPIGETHDCEALLAANDRMAEFVKSDDGRSALTLDLHQFLMTALRNGFIDAIAELHRQGIILLWSAFEVLFRDMFEAYLNCDPSLTRLLVSHPDTRKRFEADRIPLETMTRFGFDLSRKLGSILVAEHDFSDLRTIKAVFNVLFSGKMKLNDALSSRELWRLFQRRHLIVHRRGVVDQSYIDSSGESLPVGSRLAVTPADLNNDLLVVLTSGEALCECLVSESAN